jgi:hypothetical protein
VINKRLETVSFLGAFFLERLPRVRLEEAALAARALAMSASRLSIRRQTIVRTRSCRSKNLSLLRQNISNFAHGTIFQRMRWFNVPLQKLNRPFDGSYIPAPASRQGKNCLSDGSLARLRGGESATILSTSRRAQLRRLTTQNYLEYVANLRDSYSSTVASRISLWVARSHSSLPFLNFTGV